MVNYVRPEYQSEHHHFMHMYYRWGTYPTQFLLNIKHLVVISAIINN